MGTIPAVVFPDTLADYKVWLSNHPLLTPLIGARVFFRTPDTTPTPPWVRIYQAGGAPGALEDYPADHPRISHEIWGTSGLNYQAIRQVELALKSALYFGGMTLLNPAGLTVLMSGTVVSAVDAPDPDLGWPRRVVDALLHVRIA